MWLRSSALDRAAGVRRAAFWQPATCGAAPAALTAYRLRPRVRRVGGTVGVRAPCFGCVSFGLRRATPTLLGLAWLGQPRPTRASVFAEGSVARRSVLVFGHRERVCLLAYKAASSMCFGRAGGWRSGTRAFSGLLRWLVFRGVSDAAGTRAKRIDNRVMAKKTKAKAPAKKPSAAKAKKPSASSSGGVVEVEACKS